LRSSLSPNGFSQRHHTLRQRKFKPELEMFPSCYTISVGNPVESYNLPITMAGADCPQIDQSPKYFSGQGTGTPFWSSNEARVPGKEAILKRIDALVVPHFGKADYNAFRDVIKPLLRSYEAWRNYHELAHRKRGADAVVQVVTTAQFRDHMQRRDAVPATLAELLRCASDLAT
jgi:hypothetical protein